MCRLCAHPTGVYEIDRVAVGVAVTVYKSQEFANSTVYRIAVDVAVLIQFHEFANSTVNPLRPDS